MSITTRRDVAVSDVAQITMIVHEARTDGAANLEPAWTLPSPLSGALTAIVPTKNSARTLERCLRSLRAQQDADGRPVGVTVVVVDNHSTDATCEIALRFADVVETAGPERSAQRNRGLARAASDHVVFIDSDMVLEPLVCAQMITELQRGDVGAVIVPEESFGEGFWASCRALEKRISAGDVRTEAARGFRVEALARAGGWDETLTAAEDWDLTDRVASSYRIGRTSALIHHDEGRPTLRGVFAKKRYYGRWVGTYLEQGRDDAGSRRRRVSPLRILGRPALLIRQPIVGVGLIVLKAVDATGVLLGMRSARKAAP